MAESQAIARVRSELEKKLPNANIRAISTSSEANELWDLLGVFYSNPPPRGSREMLKGYSTMPWLRAVTDKISSSVATTTWRVFTKTGQNSKGQRVPVRAVQIQNMRYEERKAEIARLKAAGDLVEIEEHPLIDALYATGPTFTGYTTRELTQKWLDLVGEAFWAKVRNPAGMPVAFVPIPPHWITNTPSQKDNVYEVQTPRGGNDTFLPEDLIWFYHPNPDDPYARGSGMGVTLGDELETDEYAAKFMKTFFYNSARPDYLISSGTLKKEDTKRFERRWIDKLRGWQRSFLPFFLNREVTVHQLGTDYGHLSMLDLRKNQRDAVIQVYGVPPETLGIVEASNRATSEVAEYLYARWVLVPRLEFLRQILQHNLVPDYDDKIILDYDSPVAQDKEHILKIATIAPWSLMVDEWREMQGKLPLADGLGQVFMKPLNFEAITAEDLANPPSQQGDDDVPADQDPENEPTDDDPEEEVEESVVRRAWPELITNVISRQRVTPKIGTRHEQVAKAIRDACVEIADTARTRAADIELVASTQQATQEPIAEILYQQSTEPAMAHVLSKLTSVYVLAAELAKSQLALLADDEEKIAGLEPLFEIEYARSSAEKSILAAIRSAIFEINLRAEDQDAESRTSLMIDGVGIRSADAEEFVKHNGEGDEVLPFYETFADETADHAITHMVNCAQEALWSQAAAEGVISDDAVSRLWITRLSCRSCCECAGMDGKTAGIDMAWKLPEGDTVVTPTEAHYECHCTERLVRKEA